MSPLIRIENVYIYPRDERRIWGAWIDSPKKGDEIDVYSLNLMGWALGRDSRAVAIEYLHAGVKLGRVPIDLARPDIPKAFPDAKDALTSGFRASLSVVPLPLESDIFIQAVLEDETRVPIAVITLRRQPVAAAFQPRLQPLLVHMLDRDSSTRVMRLLGEHPQIAAYRPFENEPRMLACALELLKTASDPARYSHAIAGDEADAATAQPILNFRDGAIHQWLGRSNVEAVAGFAMQRVDDFYREVARLQGKTGALFFAEKCGPGIFVPNAVSELYSSAKEIILVRDFRDIICTRLSSGSNGKCIREFRPAAVRTLEHWREREKTAHLLRYEDFVLRPEITLQALLAYLGLDASESIIRGMLDRAAALPPAELPTEAPAATIGRWRHDLDDTRKAQCADAFSDVLEQFGYCV